MSIYDTLSPDAMLDYIKETPNVLHGIIENRKEITKEFVAEFVRGGYKKIYIVGSGTSYHGGVSVRCFMEKTLGISVDACYPMLFKQWIQVMEPQAIVIGISQGGESKSTIAGLEYAREKGAKTVSLTEKGKDSKLAGYADIALQICCGDEFAGPKTKGYQATMLTLILMSVEAAFAMGTLDENAYQTIIKRLEKTADNLERVIEASIRWYDQNRDELKKANRILVIGYENNYGNVLEGRLKIEEAVRYGIEGYELEEFMHGIYHSIDDQVQILYLASQGQYKDRIIRLRNFLADYTTHGYLIGNLDEENSKKQKNLSVEFVDDEDFNIFEYIIPLQCVAFFLSKDLGINANIPKIINFHYLIGSK